MESVGRLDERYDEVDEIVKARKVASPQLVGTPSVALSISIPSPPQACNCGVDSAPSATD